MKKLFLMSVAAAAGMSASAQHEAGTGASAPVRLLQDPAMIGTHYSVPATGTVLNPKGGRGSAKATAGVGRWYSYAGYIDLVNPIPADSIGLPYMWHKGNAKAIYSDGSGGFVADTIQLASVAIAFDPTFTSGAKKVDLGGYNDPTAGFDPNSIVVQKSDAYTIDSVRLWGVYGRNNSKSSVVDTVRFSVVYGTNTASSDMRTDYFFSGFTARYGYDTVYVANINYDANRGTSTGTNMVVKDLYLTPADTSVFNIRSFAVAIGKSIPAGNVVGVTATFISGDASFVPYKDTTFLAGGVYNFGMIRPRIFAQTPAPFSKSAPGYPDYYPGYFNIGYVKFIPEPAAWKGSYLPSYAFTSGAFQEELPDIDVKVSCGACKSIKELGIKEVSAFDAVKAFPNPAQTEVTIPFIMKEKAVATVTVTNMLGQVIATNQYNVNAGQQVNATFNTSAMNTGVYMYTISANGQQISERFTVAH